MSETPIQQMQGELLRRAYVAFFVEHQPFFARDVCVENGWDEGVFERAVDEADGLKRHDSARHRITAVGVLDAERRGLPDPHLVESNKRVRTALLCCFGEVNEREGRHASLDYREALARASAETGADPTLVEANFQFLLDYRELESRGSVSTFGLTYLGLLAWRAWQRRDSLYKRFEGLRSTEPHARGREFNDLFGQLASGEGWAVDVSVNAPGEEIDVVMSREDSFYLVECKWWNEPIGTEHIRSFEGKLGDRLGVQGVFVSMSGFTKEARARAERTTGQTPMIFVGPVETAELFDGRRNLNELLVEKKRSLILKRQVAWC